MTDVFDAVAFVELMGEVGRDPLVTDIETVALRGAGATTNLFQVLGVEAALGRTLRDEDAVESVVLLSHTVWGRVFGSDVGIVGKVVRLDGILRTVIGVLPQAFQFTYPNATEFWVPLPPGRKYSNQALLTAVARLGPEVTVPQATAALRTIEGFDRPGWGAPVAQPLSDWMSSRVRPAMYLGAATAALLLLTEYTNVTVLLMVRSARHARDNAIRAAIGASRVRLLRQVMVESAVIGALGAAAGILMALLLLPFVLWVVPTIVPRIDEITVDRSAFVLAANMASLCTVFAGWAAHRLVVSAGIGDLRGSAQPSTTTSRTGRVGLYVLVAGQTTVLVSLLVLSGLLLHSFTRLWQVDLGFATENLIGFQVRPWVADGTNIVESRQRLAQAVLSRVQTLPGVFGAAGTDSLPFTFREGRGVFPRIRQAQGNPRDVSIELRQATPTFFALLGIHLLAGFSARQK